MASARFKVPPRQGNDGKFTVRFQFENFGSGASWNCVVKVTTIIQSHLAYDEAKEKHEYRGFHCGDDDPAAEILANGFIVRRIPLRRPARQR